MAGPLVRVLPQAYPKDIGQRARTQLAGHERDNHLSRKTPKERRSVLSNTSILLCVTSNCSDALAGRVFASLPLDRATLEWLRDRVHCFRKAREAYPELYETYEFHSLPQWYESDAGEKYENQADRSKLEQLAYGFESDLSFRDDLDRLETQQIPWLAVPRAQLPGEGNLRTECDQLIMSTRGKDSSTLDLRWFCSVKHTDIELRTMEITSEDIDRWLSRA
jgi:hypothetical protein